eukprot:15358742-Ditylum_brightwellii.AAC.1
MIHGKCLASVVVYIIYLEAEDGLLYDKMNKIEDPMTFCDFRENFSIQLLTYKPTNYLYMGYKNICICVVQNTKRRMHGHPKKDDDKHKIITKNEKGKAYKAHTRKVVW